MTFSFPKKTLIFLTGLIMIIVLLIVVVLLGNKNPSAPVPSPTPVPLAPQGDAGVVEKQENLKKNQSPLLDFTPYQTPSFAITYIGPLHLKVALFAQNKEKTKEEALAWIKSKGVDPTSHEITFEDFSTVEDATPQP